MRRIRQNSMEGRVPGLPFRRPDKKERRTPRAADREDCPPREDHAFSLIELLVVVAIMAVILTLGITAYRGMADMNISTSAAVVQSFIGKARQLALSHNKYTQVRFYRPVGATDGYEGIGIFVADSPYYEKDAAGYDALLRRKVMRQEGVVEFLPTQCRIADGAASELLDRLEKDTQFTRTGTSKLRDTTYEWVAFYFRPNGATDFQELGGTAMTTALSSFTLVTPREHAKTKPNLPPNYAAFTVSASNGYVNLVRP